MEFWFLLFVRRCNLTWVSKLKYIFHKNITEETKDKSQKISRPSLSAINNNQIFLNITSQTKKNPNTFMSPTLK